jgi:hypothetical protein
LQPELLPLVSLLVQPLVQFVLLALLQDSAQRKPQLLILDNRDNLLTQ